MLMKIAFLLVVFLLLLVHPQNSSSADFLQGVPGVIFSAEETQAMMARTGEHPDLRGPFWTPSEQQVMSFERCLPAFLKNLRDSHIRRELVLYKRQYFGITRNGVKKILANFFCEQYWKFNDDWRDKIVVSRSYIGDCFFKVYYDPSTGEVFDLLMR